MAQIFNLFQLVGGLILTVGYIPQIKQILCTKSVKDLNFSSFLSIFLGIACMEVYAIYLLCTGVGQMFFVTNTMSTILSGTMIILILKYRK